MFELTPITAPHDMTFTEWTNARRRVSNENYARRLALIVAAIEDATDWREKDEPALQMMLMDARNLLSANAA